MATVSTRYEPAPSETMRPMPLGAAGDEDGFALGEGGSFQCPRLSAVHAEETSGVILRWKSDGLSIM